MPFKDEKLNEIALIMTLVTGQKRGDLSGAAKTLLAITECSH